MKLFPEAKLICLVRDVAWIMDSMERQFRDNAFEDTRIFGHANQRATVYTRVESLAGANIVCTKTFSRIEKHCNQNQALS